MKIINGVFFLDDEPVTFNTDVNAITYTDKDGNKINIPVKLIIRFYEFSKWYYEKNEKNIIPWDTYCNNFFKEKKNL